MYIYLSNITYLHIFREDIMLNTWEEPKNFINVGQNDGNKVLWGMWAGGPHSLHIFGGVSPCCRAQNSLSGECLQLTHPQFLMDFGLVSWVSIIQLMMHIYRNIVDAYILKVYY